MIPPPRSTRRVVLRAGRVLERTAAVTHRVIRDGSFPSAVGGGRRVGVPHSRRRSFWVGGAAGGRRAVAVGMGEQGCIEARQRRVGSALIWAAAGRVTRG